MIQFFQHLILGKRKYTYLLLLVFSLALLLGFFAPGMVQNIKDDGDEILSELEAEITNEIVTHYEMRKSELLGLNNRIKQKLLQVSDGESNFESEALTIASSVSEPYCVEIFNRSSELIAWNSGFVISEKDFTGKYYPKEECFFYRAPLETHLVFIDTLLTESGAITILTSRIFEKHYVLSHPHFREISFSKQLETEYLTSFTIQYKQDAVIPKDGRMRSFSLFNNANESIATVTFTKPSLGSEVQKYRIIISAIQAGLFVLAYLLLALVLRKDYKNIPYKSLKLVLFLVYITVFRWLLYKLEIPSGYIEGAIVDAKYFSSTFGYGIVRSPIEFFLTGAIFFIGARQFYSYIRSFYEHPKGRFWRKGYTSAVLTIVILPIILLGLRGLAAVAQSVIFDSTLRYFREPEILPDVPSLIINAGILLIGTGILLLSVSMLLLPFLYAKSKPRRVKNRLFLGISVLLFVFGAVFILSQDNPLINVVVMLVCLFLIVLLWYAIIYKEQESTFHILLSLLIGSIITVIFLNFLNADLERRSLKRTAYALNRPNDNFIEFLIEETLMTSSESAELLSAFRNPDANYDALALSLWSESVLESESFQSSLFILDRRLRELGGFAKGEQVELLKASDIFSSYQKEMVIRQLNTDDSVSDVMIAGVHPIRSRDILQGYIFCAVSYNKFDVHSDKIPLIFRSNENPLNDVVSLDNLSIFTFRDSVLTNVYGNFYPSVSQSERLLNVTNQNHYDAWVELTFQNETYTTFVVEMYEGDSRLVTAVAMREKETAWNLFNFFKLFIVHAVLISVIYLVVIIIRFREFKTALSTLRSQLLISFLFVSILPLIALAAYNRDTIEQRTRELVRNTLEERIEFLEHDLKNKLRKSPYMSFDEVCAYIAHATGINYTLYKDTKIYFSSDKHLTNSWLFSPVLHAQAHMNINLYEYNEYFADESLDGYKYHSLYKKVELNGDSYVLGVNDALNVVQTGFTAIDFDIFLFGVYSFAILFIVIIGTYLSSRISRPIARLTTVTQSVAHGDLNARVAGDHKGEMKKLVDGFNMMIAELRKNEEDIASLERENAWKEIARQVAHEIKNPLTPMKLNVQHLLSALKDESPKLPNIMEKVLPTLLNQIETLNQIASEFSRFARMPSFKLEKMEIIPMIEEIVQLFQEEKIQLNQSFNVERAYTEADEFQFKRMLINLVRNSIQAEATKIDFDLHEESGQYYLRISDNGSGIPEEIINKIFELNFTTKSTGMGLGLKLARRFVEGIGGEIYVEESSEQGTTFLLKIPKIS